MVSRMRNIPILGYYALILFPELSGEWVYDRNFCHLLCRSYPLTSYLIKKHLGIEITEDRFNVKTMEKKSARSDESYRLMVLLLRYERECHDLIDVDRTFLIILFENTKEKDSRLFRRTPSPILILLSKTVDVDNDFYKFRKMVDGPIRGGEGARLNYKMIRKRILDSVFEEIKSLIGMYYRVYPECMGVNGIVSGDREKYWINPLTIPLEFNHLITYVPILSNGIHQIIDLKMVYIEKILMGKNRTLGRKILRYWISDAAGDEIVEKIVDRRMIRVEMMDYIVKNVPALEQYFWIVLKCWKKTSERYQYRMLQTILKYYPREEYLVTLNSGLSG